MIGLIIISQLLCVGIGFGLCTFWQSRAKRSAKFDVSDTGSIGSQYAPEFSANQAGFDLAA